MVMIYMIFVCVGLIIICSILCYKILQYRKNILNLRMQALETQNLFIQKEQNFILKERELQLQCNHLEEKICELQLNNDRNIANHNSSIEILKREYENKLTQQEQTLQKCYEQHSKDIINMQELYEKKLQESLQNREKQLQEQTNEKQEVLRELLHTERQKQEALFTQRFYELSDKLLDEKTKQFQENQTLSLKPLHDEIVRFKHEIAQNTKEHNEKQVALHTEIKHLRDMSMQVARDANNLANAMRGDSKMQGQWGEVILERLLEKSGLQKNREYYTQFTLKDESNQTLRPDVVIQLPHKRFVVIDSKVSLNAYEKFVNNDTNTSHDMLDSHVESVKTHIRNLSFKQYQDYVDGQKLDFIVMFMPIEGAYNEILREDMNIFLDAYQKGIILSSPSTLMVILRLIHHLWENEAKDKNMQKILDECTKLIKKFHGFTENMDKINRALETAKSAYDKADTQIRGKGSMASYLRNLNDYMSKVSYPDERVVHMQIENPKILDSDIVDETIVE